MWDCMFIFPIHIFKKGPFNAVGTMCIVPLPWYHEYRAPLAWAKITNQPTPLYLIYYNAGIGDIKDLIS